MCSGFSKEEGLRVKVLRKLAKLFKKLRLSKLSQVVDYLGSRFTLKRYDGNSYQTKREVERRHKIFNDTSPHDDIDDLIEALEFENFMRDEYKKK
jgi:hypothetical protein